jgi:hypothetical protein
LTRSRGAPLAASSSYRRPSFGNRTIRPIPGTPAPLWCRSLSERWLMERQCACPIAFSFAGKRTAVPWRACGFAGCLVLSQCCMRLCYRHRHVADSFADVRSVAVRAAHVDSADAREKLLARGHARLRGRCVR